MSADFSELELGFVVSLGSLREALKELNIDGRRWWVASDPHDAAEQGYVTLAHGCEGCVDRLNTLHFRVPVVGNGDSDGSLDRLILMIDRSTADAEEPGYYLLDDRETEDPAEDFFNFYEPIERALIARLQAKN
jgi:hypothetical protein